MKKRHLFLSVVAGVALSGVLQADDSAVATSPSAAVASSASADSPTASVAKNDAPGSLKAGKALLEEGKNAEAAAYFEGIGQQVADHGLAKREPYRLLDLATAYLGLGNYPAAADAASKALALKKDLEPAWNDLASAQVNQGKRDEAIATYTKGIAELTTDQVDFSRLDANLKALQAAAGDDKSDAGTPAAPTAVSPAAVSPAAAAATPAQ